MTEYAINNRDRMPVTILMADDDEEDRMLAREALEAARLANDLHEVANGQELIDYLYRRGEWAPPAEAPRPGLILLDLNMPRMTGHEALDVIKRDPALRQIPVVVLTTSKTEEDIFRSYDLGVSSFVKKPVTFDGLIEVMKAFSYWLEIVELPLRHD